MNRPAIVVHGGAWFIPEDRREASAAGCRRAALIGWEHLVAGDSALDAVEAAVRILEDDPVFDAGRGSYLNQAGEVELDAIIMDGRTLELGAVAAVQRIMNPVILARLVMEECEHNFMVGRGAEAFAESQGLSLCDPAHLMGQLETEGWTPPGPSDTVGAVALDFEGNLAVATSTGGTPNKLPGRVGDSPLVGSGAYADNLSGAASATGSGEMLMRVVISKTACDFMAAGEPAPDVAQIVMRLLHERVGGYGGIILLDPQGNVGLSHNTPHMAYAYVTLGEDVVAGTEVVG